MTQFLIFVIGYAVLAAWSPRLWAVSLPQIALFAAALFFALRARVRFPWFAAAPFGIALIGGVQWLTHSSAYRFPTANAALDWAGYAACAWLAAQSRLSSSVRDRLLAWWAYFAGAVGVLAILTSLTSPFRIFWVVPVRFEQVFGPYVYRNHLAAFAELSLPLTMYLAIRERERRPAFVAIAAVLFCAVFSSGSRTGVILLLAELFAMLALAVHRRWLPVKASVAFSLMTVACVSSGVAAVGVSALKHRFAEEHPYRVRFEILGSTLDMARERPLTGWGLGNFRTVYPKFSRIDPGVVVNEAHNDWAQWAAEGGLPALLVMLAFAAWATRIGLRTGWGLGIAAVLCHALVDYPFEESSIVLLLMLLAGLGWSALAENQISHQRSVRLQSHPTVPELHPA